MMDAIIGRYRVRVEETGLVLRHAVGINFDMTPEETLGLLDFITTYRQALLSLQGCDTDPLLKSVILDGKERVQSMLPLKG